MKKISLPLSRAWSAPGSGYARLTEGVRTRSFRTVLFACAAFTGITLCLFVFIYWQTTILETARTDRSILNEIHILSHEPVAVARREIATHFAEDLDRLTFAALFSPDGKPIEGGLSAPPGGLVPDGRVHEAQAIRATSAGLLAEPVRAVALTLPGGDLLVIGRSEQDVRALRATTRHAMWLGVLPALLASLGLGLFASLRTLARVSTMNRAIARIMQGHLQDRLPAAGTGDALDQLAISCNRMLDEIERLVDELKGVGDNIAHDLRSPLARLRARLESAQRRTYTDSSVPDLIANTIADLDQSLALITALLRLGQIETTQRRSGFATVDLAALLQETYELFQPLAEAKPVSLTLDCDGRALVQADRDMLMELCVNLTDNAIKFAPAGGKVCLSLRQTTEGPVLRFADSGDGIPPEERGKAMHRFHRAAKGPAVPGHGVGLSLVAAIARLHGFALTMHDLHPGFAVDVQCRQST